MKFDQVRATFLYNVTIGKYSAEQVDQIKHLGIILDNELSLRPHIQHICTKLSSGFGH